MATPQKVICSIGAEDFQSCLPVRGLLARHHGDGLAFEVDVRIAADVDSDVFDRAAGEPPRHGAGELAATRSNAEIASGFCVSADTIKAHVKSLLREPDVNNRRSAVRPGRERASADRRRIGRRRRDCYPPRVIRPGLQGSRLLP